MGGYMALTVVLGFAICSFGLQNGVERITKGMMCALIVLIAVLAVHSFTLSGAKDGLAFFLLPDWGRAVEQGIGSVLVSAMNQAFFTLSLGIGAMEIFGSYMNRDHTLTGEAVRICALDTFVAVSAGLIIFPASPTAFRRMRGRASSSSPCRTSSPAWRAAACGARCSSCL